MRANIDDLTGGAGDPEQKLDQAIAEMGDRLVDMKNLVAASVAEEARLKNLGRPSEMLEEQRRATEDLKRALVLLNDKIEEAKARRDTLRLRGRSAQVAEAVHAATSGLERENVSDLLDRLEAQVQRLEMQVRVDAELEEQAPTSAAVARLPSREPVPRELGPAPTNGDDQRTPPVEPGDKKRTGR